MGNCFGTSSVDCEEKLDYSAGNVHVIADKESWEANIEEASKDGKIVVVNFSASWCAPCRYTAPLYAELSTKYPSLVFLTVDIDDLPELTSSWDVQATPTFFFLKDGKKLEKLVGANKLQLEKRVVYFTDSSTYYSKPPQLENNVS
ncbi:Thioredoxin H4-1 [Ananas comosus]|uniref:Thioredoxin H4-1 n=1 Tax=Ananas comosus TaxID=4615 RepID=A0A199URH8_ANACO|nr:Thioredoxin H4-1 [Ananas comosus]